MAEATTGEPARIAMVLSPEFLEDLEEASTDELRRRRDQALAEREYQSYLRRLIQVRRDFLVSERGRRGSPESDEPLVDRLAEVLAEGPQSRGRGEALRFTLPDGDVSEADRRAEEILSQSVLSSGDTMTDEQLGEALATLDRAEREVSLNRGAVIHVHDRLQDELKRRYREDPSQIPGQV